MTNVNENVSFDTKAGMYLNNLTGDAGNYSFSTTCLEGLSDIAVNAYEYDKQKCTTKDKGECFFKQSKGTVTFGGNMIHFELGTGHYKTRITEVSNTPAFTAFLAANQFAADVSFDFFVYSGPAICQMLLNSVFTANAAAIASALLAQRLNWKALTVQLTACRGLDSIYASYAAVAPLGDGNYRLVAILNSASIDLEGKASFGSVVPLTEAYLKTSKMSILIDAMVTFNGGTLQSAVITNLKFSLSDLSIGGPIFAINPIIWIIVQAAAESTRVVEGLLNDNYNKKIIASINKDIKSFLSEIL